MRINEVPGCQAFSTTFTLVTIRIFISAIWTSTRNIPVGKKHFGFFVIVLLGFVFGQNFFIVEVFKKFLRCFMMNLFAGAVIDIKRYSKLFETFLDNSMILIY